MKVKDLTVDELKALIRDTIEEKLQELMGDPDWNLELKEDIKERLKRSLEQTEKGERGIPVEDVAKKTGLRW